MANFDTGAQAFVLWWIARDKQSSLPMGEFVSHGAAEAAIPGALHEMLGQCGEEFQRESIRAGSWSVQAPTA